MDPSLDEFTGWPHSTSLMLSCYSRSIKYKWLFLSHNNIMLIWIQRTDIMQLSDFFDLLSEADMYHCLLTVSIIAVAIYFSSGFSDKDSPAEDAAVRRPKRILGGEQMKNRAEIPYKVIEYYVWMGRVWDCYEDASTWQGVAWGLELVNRIKCLYKSEKKENLKCGGALIAPKIVQTACHCLAKLVTQKVWSFEWGTAALKNHFENRLWIYMGKTDVYSFDNPVKSVKFIVHEKCGRYSESPRHTRYDIGWLITGPNVWVEPGVLTGTWGKLDYAGPYRQADLKETYEKSLGQMLICLVVGFGLNDKEDKASRYMRQHWIQLLDWTQCQQALYTSSGHSSLYNYSEASTIICARQLDKVSYNNFKGMHGSGDSGSPITCNNEYVGLVSGIISFKKLHAGFIEIMGETAINCAPEANAVEMREEWETRVTASRYQGRIDLRTLWNPKRILQLRHSEGTINHVTRTSGSSSGNLMLISKMILCYVSLIHIIGE